MLQLLALGVLMAGAIAFAGDQPSGEHLVNPAGDVATANNRLGRGINLGNALEAPKEGAWGLMLQAEYFRVIKAAGFATVRLPVRWSGHAQSSTPYTIDLKFAERVDWAVDQALANRLNVVLNVHHYDEMNTHPAEHLPRLVALWEQIAARYKDRPPEVYFELLNEPRDNLTELRWNTIIPQLLAAVRKTNPVRPVIVGPGQWNAIEALDKLELPADDRNLIVTVHFYDPFPFTHQGAPWVKESNKWTGQTWSGTEAEQAAVRKSLAQAMDWAKERGRSIFLGEFGVFRGADMESRLRWTRFVAREAERLGFSWAYWDFGSEFGAYDPKTGVWTALLSVLLE
jgi:endoglucanase